MYNDRVLPHLISLLDDPDTYVYKNVSRELLVAGHSIIQELESAWENNIDPLFQARVENIIHQLQLKKVRNQLSDWKHAGGKNLLEGAVHLANYQYPDVTLDDISLVTDKITQEIWLELNPRQTALEMVKIINYILFQQHKFRGNKTNVNAPKNNYINEVIQTHKGNPITLAIIYLEIAAQLKLPIYGVNIPGHFILAYTKGSIYDETLFYITPFNKGLILNHTDIKKYLKKFTQKNDIEKALQPCTNPTIISRLTQQLYYTYDHLSLEDKKEDVESIMALFNENIIH